MIRDRKWNDVTKGLPEPGRLCLVRRIMPSGNEWRIWVDFVRRDNHDWQMFSNHPRIGRLTHWCYISREELDELNAQKKMQSTVRNTAHSMDEDIRDVWPSLYDNPSETEE